MWSKNLKCAAISASVAMLLLVDPAFCEPANINGYPKSIPFQSPDRLGEYSVSGLWFPEGLIPTAGLSGPAVFVFRNANSGEQWTVAVNAIALLNRDFWNEHGVADAARLEPEALLEKLASFGVVSLPLSQDKRAKVVTCGPSTSDPPAGRARKAEQCLDLGEAVVDLQDIDFDGAPELVFSHAGLGQRFVPTYEVVRIPEDGQPALGADTTEPFREIDGLTLINLTRKQIIIRGSNGACANTAATYSRDSNGAMRMMHFWRGVWQEPDRCDVENYAVENSADGIGRRLKLLSRNSLK